MSKVCEICGKAPSAGRNVSHSHRVTNRTFRPNIQKVTIKLNGKVKRANAGHAALQCFGVFGMAQPAAANGLAKFLHQSPLRKGVIVSVDEDGVLISLYVVLEHGVNINVVSTNLVDQVTFALEEFVQAPLKGIDVHVQGIKVR